MCIRDRNSLDSAWEEVSPLHKKLATNAMIGLWANPKQYTFLTKVHEPEYDDTLFEGAKVRRILEEFALQELVLRFQQCSNSSMATLHRQIMDAEALLMARICYELRQCIPARQIRECRVDSVLFQAGRRVKSVLEKVASLTYADLNAPPQDNCFQKFVRHNHELQSNACLLYTSPSPRDRTRSRMPSSA